LLRLHLRPGRGDVLWQLDPDGPRGLPECASREHAGWGLPCLHRGNAVLLAGSTQTRLLGGHQEPEAPKPAVVPLLGRAGRRVPGLRLRIAVDSAADGGAADPAALFSLPAVSVAMDQPRIRGDEHRRLHRRLHGGAGFDAGLARHRNPCDAAGPAAFTPPPPSLPPCRPLLAGALQIICYFERSLKEFACHFTVRRTRSPFLNANNYCFYQVICGDYFGLY